MKGLFGNMFLPFTLIFYSEEPVVKEKGTIPEKKELFA